MADTLALTDAPADALPKQVGDPNKPRHRAGTRRAMSELLDMQAALMADIRNPKTPPHWRAACVRAWNDAEERKRILRGLPLPGALKPVQPDKRRKPDAVVMGD